MNAVNTVHGSESSLLLSANKALHQYDICSFQARSSKTNQSGIFYLEGKTLMGSFLNIVQKLFAKLSINIKHAYIYLQTVLFCTEPIIESVPSSHNASIALIGLTV